MVRIPGKRALKKKKQNFSLFLAASVLFHSLAAAAAPAFFYFTQPRNNQNFTYIDVVEAKKPSQAVPGKLREEVHDAAPSAPTPEGPAVSENEPQTAPGEADDADAVPSAPGPLKSAGNQTMVASVEKDISTPDMEDGIQISGEPASGEETAILKGKSKNNDDDRAGGSEDIKTYVGGLPAPSGEKGAGTKPAPVFSSESGIGPTFHPAEIKTAEASGVSGGMTDSDGAGNISTAHPEKEAAGSGAGGGKGVESQMAGDGNGPGGGEKIGLGDKRNGSGTAVAFDEDLGGAPVRAEKKSVGIMGNGIENIEPSMNRAAIAAIPAAGIEIKSPSDGSVIDCTESTDIVVAGKVKGKVDKVRIYINGVAYEGRAEKGFFKIAVPAQAELNFIYAEGFDIYGNRCVSEKVSCRTVNLDPVDMVVYLSCKDGGKLKLNYTCRPYPKKGVEGGKREYEFNLRDGGGGKVLTVSSGARGIYTFGLENTSGGQERGEVHVCLFPRDASRKRVRRLGTIVLGGGAAANKLVRVLMPEGVFWDDDGWFSGEIESTRETIKYKQPEGIAWSEEK